MSFIYRFAGPDLESSSMYRPHLIPYIYIIYTSTVEDQLVERFNKCCEIEMTYSWTGVGGVWPRWTIYIYIYYYY